MVVTTELARNDFLQLTHPYVISVLDVEKKVKKREELVKAELLTCPAEGYDAWVGFEADISTDWTEIFLHGDFQQIEIEPTVEAYIRRLGARFSGERHLRANQTITIPTKVRSFEARTVSGTGKIYGSAVGM